METVPDDLFPMFYFNQSGTWTHDLEAKGLQDPKRSTTAKLAATF